MFLMKAYQASLINSIVLITMGLWGVFASPSITAYIPIIIGCLLLFLNGGVKKENKHLAHIAVLLTLLSFGSIMPLTKGLGEGDVMKIMRQSLILLSSFFAMIMFVKSFIAARKNKS